MQPMSDKELDKLFQQRFSTFETAPSAATWNKIADKLDRKKPAKKTFPVFGMAAASVIVVLGAGLWLFNPKETIRLRGKADEQRARQQIDTSTAILPVAVEQQTALTEQKIAVTKSKAVLPDKTGLSPADMKSVALHPVRNKKINRLSKQQQIVSVAGAVFPVGNLAEPVITRPVLAINTEEPEAINEPAEEAARPKIRSLGSLVNFVVAQVDRREDKIIEFTDDEEGSSVSGINLGLVKLKSRNK